jgi:hypothetical protein
VRRGAPPPRPRPGRRRRPAVPVFEPLEGRILLADASPLKAALVRGEVGQDAQTQALGAAYREVEASQSATLGALGDAYRQIQVASLRFSQRAAATINALAVALDGVRRQELSDSRDGDREAARRDQAKIAAITSAYDKDQQILARGESEAEQAEHGLLVSQGIENQSVVTAKSDITNNLFTNLQVLVAGAVTSGTAVARRGQQRSAVVIHDLNTLGDQLVASVSAVEGKLTRS